MATAGTRLVDKYKVVHATPPANYTGAASASSWVSFKNYYHATIIIKTGAWAGGTAAVTLNQATDVSGTGSKAVAFDTVFISTSTADAEVSTAVTANTFNLTAANTMYIIEINGTDLDKTNSFLTLQAAIASPGANNDFYDVAIILGNMPRFGFSAALLPTAIA